MATLISVSWAYKYFMGSLLSIPLHRLGRISFSANWQQVLPWQHFFSVSLTFIPVDFLHSKPLHE